MKIKTEYILIAVSLILVLALTFFIRFTASKPVKPQVNPEQIEKKVNLMLDEQINKVRKIEDVKPVKQDEPLRIPLDPLYEKLDHTSTFVSLGFSDRGAEILNSKDPTKTLKIEDYTNPDIRKEIEESYRELQENGYLPISEHDINQIYDASKNIYDVSKSYPYIDFEPSQLDLDNNLTYEGAYLDKGRVEFIEQFNGEMKLPYVTTVYTDSNGDKIVFTEERMQEGISANIEEFVTDRVNDYPVVIHKFHNKESGKSIIRSESSDGQRNYELSYINNKTSDEEAKKRLLQLNEGLLLHD